MKPGMDRALADLAKLVGQNALTAGMAIRAVGENLVLAREEPDGSNVVAEDRVRLTRLGPSSWGLSVKRHTGRWERTPFSGTMKSVVEAIWAYMQHLVAPYQ